MCKMDSLEKKEGARSLTRRGRSISVIPNLLNGDNSFSLSLPLFLDLYMSPSSGANCVDIASATSDHPTDCIQWD